MKRLHLLLAAALVASACSDATPTGARAPEAPSLNASTSTQGHMVGGISGITYAYSNQVTTFHSVWSGGHGPYTYKWYRNGVLISTAPSITINVGTTDFLLTLKITDACGDVLTDSHTVYVDSFGGGGGPA
jgi:ABC-type glycerol-3-phosphate transport system substrate-binding protein